LTLKENGQRGLVILKDIELVTIETINRMSRWDKRIALDVRKDWLEKERKQGRKELNNLKTKISWIRNPARRQQMVRTVASIDGFAVLLKVFFDENGTKEFFWLQKR